MERGRDAEGDGRGEEEGSSQRGVGHPTAVAFSEL